MKAAIWPARDEQPQSWHRALDGVEEAHELLVPVALHAAAEHGAFEHVKGGEQCGPALGLTPSRYQSGQTDRLGAITKAADATARVALFEAAHVMMTRLARWFPLKAWAMRVPARRGAKRAKVALARRLAVFLNRMWLDGHRFPGATGMPPVTPSR